MMSEVIRQETIIFLLAVVHGTGLTFLYDLFRRCGGSAARRSCHFCGGFCFLDRRGFSDILFCVLLYGWGDTGVCISGHRDRSDPVSFYSQRPCDQNGGRHIYSFEKAVFGSIFILESYISEPVFACHEIMQKNRALFEENN